MSGGEYWLTPAGLALVEQFRAELMEKADALGMTYEEAKFCWILGRERRDHPDDYARYLQSEGLVDPWWSIN